MTATAEDKIITEFELDGLAETVETPAEGQDGDATAPEAAPAAESAPFARIVKGNPTDEEIGALVAVLSAAAAAGSGEPQGDGKPPETWGNPTRMHRQWAPFSPYSYPNRG